MDTVHKVSIVEQQTVAVVDVTPALDETTLMIPEHLAAKHVQYQILRGETTPLKAAVIVYQYPRHMSCLTIHGQLL